MKLHYKVENIFLRIQSYLPQGLVAFDEKSLKDFLLSPYTKSLCNVFSYPFILRGSSFYSISQYNIIISILNLFHCKIHIHIKMSCHKKIGKIFSMTKASNLF